MNELTQKLSKILRMNLPKDFTSVSYAIMKDGEIIAADALGTQGGTDKKPATVDCTYNVASVSKIYCTVAVMQLVEVGKLDLDEPIVTYLPDFKMLDERYRKITLRHCLSHSSGLPGTQWKGFSVADVSRNTYYQEVYAHMAKSHLKAEPGAYSVYCNDGFTMAEMVVAKVSGMDFADYCLKYITEPIGAHSTRLSPTMSPEHPLVHEGKKPGELLFIQGGAGFTTTMTDLCKFGSLFLTDNPIIGLESKAEMAKKQGTTFLPCDERSPFYGLGWDNVSVSEPEYDLGEGVLLKGGNSFQFTTQFLVIPKLNAVLAISETHDCKLDVGETILRMFATAMLDRGINLYTKQKPVPQSMIDQFSGAYLTPGAVLNTHFYGTTLNVTRDNTRGGSEPFVKNLKFNGEVFLGENDQTYSFAQHEGDKYIMTTFKGRRTPQAMKAKDFPALSPAWEKRVGKRYIAVNATPGDLVINEIMTGFQLAKLPGHEGVLIASFSGIPDGDVYGLFEASFVPESDDIGKGFLNTPTNGSRDLIDPCFAVIDGIEHCYVASYLYRDAATLPVYAGQGFGEGDINQVYQIKEELKELPKVPEGRRILVLKEDMSVCHDTLFGGDYKPVKEGYLSLI